MALIRTPGRYQGATRALPGRRLGDAGRYLVRVRLRAWRRREGIKCERFLDRLCMKSGHIMTSGYKGFLVLFQNETATRRPV